MSQLSCYSQEKCGTDQYQQILHQRLSLPENEDRFEGWIYKRISEKRISNFFINENDETIYTIPVVVHIIHQGEALGTRSNIPDEQITSQIETLNEDFRRLNADASSTPTEFLPVAADIKIEFVLAKRDPEGLPTNGIVRKKSQLASYSFNTDRELKAQSYWPAEDYLNLWITTISGNLLGYAQFPTSNLEGMDVDQSISRLTDGIVIDYQYMGTGYNAVAFSKGRTATHEIGHFLGLRHIWGEGGCSSDDFCDDTPIKSGSTEGCPSAGSVESCGSVDMFQNFLDFSDDLCMNLFTTCQSQRMRTILENSPRRKSLITSKALQDPIVVANDLGIRQILSPLSGDCSTAITPQIEVRNYGLNTIESFEIDLYIDNVFIEKISKNTIISELGSSLVSFDEITIAQSGVCSYRFEITETNGVDDGNEENNTLLVNVSFSEEEQIPFFEDFESSISKWNFQSTSGGSSWSQQQAPYQVINNTGMVLSYFQSPAEKYGETDFLISPVFDLSSLPSADISLKYAYAAYPGNITDVFTIAVSTDCGNTFPEENYVFQKFSPPLSTTGLSTDAFVPEGTGDWEELDINITEFVGNENVVIAFIGHNGGGNNLYIDDFSITSENKLDYDLSLRSVYNTPAVTCGEDIFPSIEVKNSGINTITDFTLNYELDGLNHTLFINDLDLLPGKTYTAKPGIQNIDNGKHEILFSVSNPNGVADQNTANDSRNVFFEVNTESATNPIRESFEDENFLKSWSFVRPDQAHNWTVTDVPSDNSFNKAVKVDGYNIEEIGIENWLVSPSIDFSESNEASLAFKVSYANVQGRNDRLKVLISLNCGRSYDHVVYDKKGADLAVVQQSEEWIPDGANDWKTETIDLSEYAGWNQVRVAFVIDNQNGNNLYLDDIEFFTTSEPNLLDIEDEKVRIYPSPAKSTINLKFDLKTKSDLEVQILDLMGKVVNEMEYPNTLNQTYQINNLNVDNGIYLIHVSGSGIDFSRRVLIWN
ncbi:choice-of-anchor J domain-containing protein [Reichenbachiella sp. MALMAid0571]|uniref:T9SS-dependent choice-of-anchor J family protein n=1 Tax=Reichenbachiella sp. MALMAid0571 TaxID=3143939 RepID=UPI0032DF3929